MCDSVISNSEQVTKKFSMRSIVSEEEHLTVEDEDLAGDSDFLELEPKGELARAKQELAAAKEELAQMKEEDSFIEEEDEEEVAGEEDSFVEVGGFKLLYSDRTLLLHVVL